MLCSILLSKFDDHVYSQFHIFWSFFEPLLNRWLAALLPCVSDSTFIKLTLDLISSSDVREAVTHYCPWLSVGRLLPVSTQDSVCLLWQAVESLCAQSKRNKSLRRASLHWAVSGVGLPCGNARLFRWKMVLRLVSPAWVRGRPACRTAWFIGVVISAVATWINHVARIKLLLNDAQHFPRCLCLRVKITGSESFVAAVVLQQFQRTLVDGQDQQLKNYF